jgi:hypothetical protein
MLKDLSYLSTWLLSRNEAVTNLLDLFAFCLVTPEIVGFARLQELANLLRSGFLWLYNHTIEPVVSLLITLLTSVFIIIEIITFIAIPLALVYALIVLVEYSGDFTMPTAYNYLDITENVVIVLLLLSLALAVVLGWFVRHLTEATDTGIMFVAGATLFVIARVLGFVHGLH